jgi:hypothetical protein
LGVVVVEEAKNKAIRRIFIEKFSLNAGRRGAKYVTEREDVAAFIPLQ